MKHSFYLHKFFNRKIDSFFTNLIHIFLQYNEYINEWMISM